MRFLICQGRGLPRTKRRVKPGEEWASAIVRLPTWIQPEDGATPPYRPLAALWIGRQAGVAKISPGAQTPAEAVEQAGDLLREFAGDKDNRGTLPAVLTMTPSPLAEAVAAKLKPLGVNIQIEAEIPVVHDLMRQMRKELAPDSPNSPLAGKEVRVKDLHAFAEAAALFYQAAPWKFLHDSDLIAFDPATSPAALRFGVVLGNGGQEFGIGFYATRELFEQMLGQADPEQMMALMEEHRVWNMSFFEETQLPVVDHDLFLDYNLPRSGNNLFPAIVGMKGPEDVKRPNREKLVFIEGVLRALAATTEQQVDSGAWSVRVETIDGPGVVNFSLPLLQETAEPTVGDNPAGMFALLEKVQRGLMRRYQADPTLSTEQPLQVEVDMSNLDSLNIPPAETPQEKAREKALVAMATRGRRRLHVAKEALEISPDAADAWNIIAEYAPTDEERLAGFRKAAEVGERGMDPAIRKEADGELSQYLDAKPYLRARLGVIAMLRRLGREEEALQEMAQVLDMDKPDEANLRFEYLPALLGAHRDADALQFAARYPEEQGVLWTYLTALATFRAQGPSGEATRLVREAVKKYPAVAQMLLAPDPEKMTEAMGEALQNYEGTSFEAVGHVAMLWNETPPAMDLLRQAQMPIGGISLRPRRK